ncbi:MAG: polysaccharide deacetylase family protein [Kiritimatiellaeota bacterium]|nr:polysaccharide deacetylase family protein [Kiritimatiellota bacterium]
MTALWIIAGMTVATAVVAGMLRYYWPFRRRKPEGWPRVFIYHATDEAAWPGMPGGLNTAPWLLEWQLRYLAGQGYAFVTAEELPGFGTDRKHVCLTFDDGYEDNYRHLFPLLKKYNAKATIFAAQSQKEFPGKPLLAEAQIREMAESGVVEFGGHTLNHIRLTDVDAQTAMREIHDGKAWLERVTGRPCTSFAYPYGKFTERDVQIVKGLGFRCAFTCDKGVAPIRDPYRIDRLSAHGRMFTWEYPLLLSRGKFKI